jgi:hypothetical protein
MMEILKRVKLCLVRKLRLMRGSREVSHADLERECSDRFRRLATRFLRVLERSLPLTRQ